MSRRSTPSQAPSRFGCCLPAASIILAATVATTAAVRHGEGVKPANVPSHSTTSDAQTVPTQEDEEKLARIGEETTEKVCNTACHTLDKVYEKRRTAREWGDVMASMATLGASATDAQFATVKRYLTRSFGIVPVNTATAEELSAVLGLSAKDAKAIVDHRNANGRFADTAALLKVAGIDKAKIDAQPEALVFK
jgi:competence ComEA-like helix-hairpin-helix protein